jgi:hypothetical protein
MQDLDLVVDLNTMDESGLPWAFLDAAPDPSCIVPGQHVDIDGDIVHVRPLPGPVARHRHLLGGRAAS